MSSPSHVFPSHLFLVHRLHQQTDEFSDLPTSLHPPQAVTLLPRHEHFVGARDASRYLAWKKKSVNKKTERNRITSVHKLEAPPKPPGRHSEQGADHSCDFLDK